MLEIHQEIDIFAPADRVFSWLGDPEKAQVWMTSVTHTEIEHRTPDWVGTTFREVVSEGPRSTELSGEVMEYRPNEALAFHLEGKYNSTDVSFELAESGNRTYVTQKAVISFKSIARVSVLFLGPFLKRKILMQTEAELHKLKDLCEQQD